MQHILCGQVAEWFNAPASKTGGAQALGGPKLSASAPEFKSLPVRHI